MISLKTEIWAGHEIRFVEKDGEWWGVAKDVADALEYAKPENAIKRHCRCTPLQGIPHPQNPNKILEVNIIPETDIYRLAFRSEKPEAEPFQDWVCSILKTLRQSTGLEGFEIFRMMDKEHQKTAMKKLCDGLNEPAPKDFIKCNAIANKAVSTLHGYHKMVKKGDMSPEMLKDREAILADTVTLMVAKETFNADWSVSKMVYAKHGTKNKAERKTA